MPSKPTISIVINNYNYARYLETAVESALQQTYPHVEVIVVDDGSTDGSRQLLEGYAERVRLVLKENGGQASALNAGYAASAGEIVLFLDADDALLPHTAERVASAWSQELSKVQFNLAIIDEAGRPTGRHVLPTELRLSPEDIRRHVMSKGSYETPPTSGNAFARRYLQHVMPIPEEEYRISADGYLFTLAPLYGPVVHLPEGLGLYRRHGQNSWALSRVAPELMARYVQLSLQLEGLLLREAAKFGFPIPPDLEYRHHGRMMHRLASLRLAPERHPVPDDEPLELAYHGMRALWRWSGRSLTYRVVWSLWFLLAGILPIRAARILMEWAFAPNQRPKLLRRASLPAMSR